MGKGSRLRIAALQSWKAQLDAHKDALIAALTHDTGRSLESVVEVYGLMSTIDRWCAQAPRTVKGRRTLSNVQSPLKCSAAGCTLRARRRH